MTVYNKYRQYARHFFAQDSDDVVHDIWLIHYDKTGEDLFSLDKPKNYIYRKVKWRCLSLLLSRTSKYPHNKNLIPGRLRIGEEHDPEALDLHVPASCPDVYGIISLNELDTLMKTAGVKMTKVYHYIRSGYNGREIAEQMNMSAQLVDYYKKQIRNAAKSQS